MKKLFIVLGLALMAAGPAQADERNLSLETILTAVAPFDVINWKVGDTASYKVSIASFLNGTMVKSVSKDEGTSLWVKQDLDLSIQKQVIEMQLNKADGKVLKVLINGQEQQIPNDKVEVISQDYVDVTVPAGTFKAIHIVAKAGGKNVEVWANPRDTVMEGTLKQIADTGMVGNMVMELTSFKRAQ